MPEQKYLSNSAKDCAGICSNWTTKDGMGVNVGSRADTVEQYNKSEKKVERAKISVEAKLNTQ